MLKLFNTSYRILTILFACIFASKFCKKQTDTFTILAISSHRPYHEEFATRPLNHEETKQLEKALSQPYSYFGKGGQAYVCFSSDGNYVIKFFKQRLFRPSWLLNHIPFPSFLHKFRQKRNWKRENKLQRDFFSYKVAFEKLQKETGVIYAHLNPSSHLHRKLSVTDRLGICHLIDLDQFDFIVQKKADPVYERINQLMRQGKMQEAKYAIEEVFLMMKRRSAKGFRDRDPNIETNCGFIGNQAVKIDVGRFVYSEEMQRRESSSNEIKTIITPFEKWIEETHPLLLPSYLKIKESFLE